MIHSERVCVREKEREREEMGGEGRRGERMRGDGSEGEEMEEIE